ncbi:MAG: hypothetical protein Q4Q03_01015 [Bowdeniella nasicola]|nr:hypothetical protein [Bowdeniella nasicola]
MLQLPLVCTLGGMMAEADFTRYAPTSHASDADGPNASSPALTPIVTTSGDSRFAPGAPNDVTSRGYPRGHLRPTAGVRGMASAPKAARDDGPLVFPETELVDPAVVFSQPGYQAPMIRQHPLTIPALLLSLVFFLPGVPLLGSILASIALWQMQRKRYTNRGTVINALVIGFVVSLGQLVIATATGFVFGI